MKIRGQFRRFVLVWHIARLQGLTRFTFFTPLPTRVLERTLVLERRVEAMNLINDEILQRNIAE